MRKFKTTIIKLSQNKQNKVFIVRVEKTYFWGLFGIVMAQSFVEEKEDKPSKKSVGRPPQKFGTTKNKKK